MTPQTNDTPSMPMSACREIVAILDKRQRDWRLRREEQERAGRGRGW